VPAFAQVDRVVQVTEVLSSSTVDPDIDFASRIANDSWRENFGMFRVDHRFSDKFAAYVRYKTANGTVSAPQGIFLNVSDNNLSAHNAVIQLQNILTRSRSMQFMLRLDF
jgi:hypothetical protein